MTESSKQVDWVVAPFCIDESLGGKLQVTREVLAPCHDQIVNEQQLWGRAKDLDLSKSRTTARPKTVVYFLGQNLIGRQAVVVAVQFAIERWTLALPSTQIAISDQPPGPSIAHSLQTTDVCYFQLGSTKGCLVLLQLD